MSSGGPIGKLAVTGNFSNGSTGTLQLTPTSATSPALQVGGTANLAGNLQVTGLNYGGGTTSYSLINAGGGITGTFSSSNLPQLVFLDTSLAYSANQVNLNVSRNQTAFVDVAQTRNQRGVAAALGAYSGDDDDPADQLNDQILGLDRAGAQNAFNSLSGKSMPVRSAPCWRIRATCAMPSTTACASLAATVARTTLGKCWPAVKIA